MCRQWSSLYYGRRVATSSQLSSTYVRRVRITTDALCPICGLTEETVEHVLWTCEAARDVWAVCSARTQKCTTMEVDVVTLFLHLMDKLEEDEMEKLVTVARLLWLSRNKIVFGGDFQSPSIILEMATVQMNHFNKAEQGRRVGVPKPPSNPAGLVWKLPETGIIKLNWAVALDDRSQRMGFGIIARDHEAKVVAAVSGSRPNITSPL
ncbi:uncharacterized protein LOC132189426 [Corylus avellana]|uniref:uncharacterized protein LOC132189426 n=1 Tax=Corylus avellana TaxID=13451 RepID=UPI00286B78B0|nr:uncharacterized protein LOC132189426 [Corylus avellana]